MIATFESAVVRHRPLTFAYTRPLKPGPETQLTRILTNPFLVRSRIRRLARSALATVRLLFTKPRPTSLELRMFRQRDEAWKQVVRARSAGG